MERKEQKAFDCETLTPSFIPYTAQDYVLTLLPKRPEGESDEAYRQRLPSDMHKGIFDWWVEETRQATKHKAYCKV